jgi:glycosyltransferase involved in cell wall biosynthesis
MERPPELWRRTCSERSQTRSSRLSRFKKGLPEVLQPNPSHPRDEIGVVVVMPAYNAAKTLADTFRAMPEGSFHHVILVDDGSNDETLEVAGGLEITTFVHDRNYGYGANQKTCYTEALKTPHDIIVMLHPDYQYDPTLLPELTEPIRRGEADVVFGSRLLGASPIKQGMPWWKYAANRALTKLENVVFGLHLSEYHTGYRAYSRRALEGVHFQMDSDGFVFDQDIVAQFVASGFRITEVPVPTRYFPEASSASFWQSCVYGFSILGVLTRFTLHKSGLRRDPRLVSLSGRYARVHAPRPEGDGSPGVSD